MSPPLTAGRTLLTLVAFVNVVGPYIADWNVTHVMNPNWPPHARFHNGQTMSLGLCLGVLTGYFAWRPVFNSKSPGESGMTEHESITISAVLGTLYWITGMSGILYPGAKWVDPEFGTGSPQLPLFSGLAGTVWVGWGLETLRLRRIKEKGA